LSYKELLKQRVFYLHLPSSIIQETKTTLFIIFLLNIRNLETTLNPPKTVLEQVNIFILKTNELIEPRYKKL